MDTRRASTRGSAPEERHLTRPATGSILVIDDDRVNRTLLARALELEGHDVRLAENGTVGLELLAVQRADVVLLDVSLGGVRRVGSVLFSDIRGFTTFAEAKSPDVVVTVLNRYLTEMSDAVLDNGGTLVAFRGDGIVAVFGARVRGSRRPGCCGRARHGHEATAALQRLAPSRWARRRVPHRHRRGERALHVGQVGELLVAGADLADEGAAVSHEALSAGRAQRLTQRSRKDGSLVNVEMLMAALTIDGEHSGY